MCNAMPVALAKRIVMKQILGTSHGQDAVAHPVVTNYGTVLVACIFLQSLNDCSGFAPFLLVAFVHASAATSGALRGFAFVKEQMVLFGRFIESSIFSRQQSSFSPLQTSIFLLALRVLIWHHKSISLLLMV
jgi:hypothetical protein